MVSYKPMICWSAQWQKKSDNKILIGITHGCISDYLYFFQINYAAVYSCYLVLKHVRDFLFKNLKMVIYYI